MNKTKIQYQSQSDIPNEEKTSYQPPKVLASYEKEELESALQPEGQTGGGCGCGCGTIT